MAAPKAKKKAKKVSPMMEQYYQVKGKYPDTIILIRVGDFYETFGEDAITASRVLGITLTKRGAGTDGEIELAGFPYHAMDTYLPKLVKAGFRVAIMDQLEDPKATKGLVKRGITEIVTPGVASSDKILDHKSNNFLCAIHLDKKANGISFIDISTGEFYIAEGSIAYLDKLIQSLKPSEILYFKRKKNDILEHFGERFYSYPLEDWVFQFDYTNELLLNHFKTKSLKGFGIEGHGAGIIAGGAALHYIKENHLNDLNHIKAIQRIDSDNFVWLDRFTIRNLELIYSNNDHGKSLFDVLDHTSSPMGSRLLKKWIALPLKDKQAIETRLNIVDSFKSNTPSSENIISNIKEIGDLERLIAKVPLGKVNPKDMVQLKLSLIATTNIKSELSQLDDAAIQTIANKLQPLTAIKDRIEREIQAEPPVLIDKGNVIAEGVSKDLDELRTIKNNGKAKLDEILERETTATGIPSLKISFNNVFGYYLEVRNTHKDKVPADWTRKQTLVSAERYITQELKEYEEQILTAEDKIKAIEADLFQQLVATLNEHIQAIQINAQLIAQTDVLINFASIANKYNYCKPSLDETYELDIKDGRHPVIEQQLENLEDYVPNDVYLDNSMQQMIIITGPNMAGKSALLRQTALITLMAQMGSYVPAGSANIGIVDKVFTRVGASDNISSGESTFMVEMNETASIINNLSERSLILLDEIGRGTSTYDGVSLAWSISEYIHNHPTKAKTLFATHYHELNELEHKLDRVKNFNVSVKEHQGKIIFLRKLVRGGSAHSFGIHVAQLAGMPNEVLIRANEVLKHLEELRETDGDTSDQMKTMPESQFQMNLFNAEDPKTKKIIEELDSLEINTMSPLDALLKLSELKKTLQ
jgi:DNA mismatch repair protein MutS